MRKLPETAYINQRTQKQNPPVVVQYASAKEITAALGISESKWKRDVKTGIYPKPYEFGGGTKRWKISEINECIESFPRG